jgi:hypothetical protein
MKDDSNEWEDFFGENIEYEDKSHFEETDDFEETLSSIENILISQDVWCSENDDDITPEDEQLSKQLSRQLKIESLDDEFIDKKHIKSIKKKLNAHIATNPKVDIINIAAKMISYRDKKIQKNEKDSGNI